MKILLIQHHNFLNGSGGTEKICTFLANGFSDFGYSVEIATCQNIKGKPMFFLNENIKITNIFSENISQTELKSVFNYIGFNPLKWIYFKLKKKQTKRHNKKLLRRIGGNDEFLKKNLRQRAKAWKKYIDDTKPDIVITMSISSLLEITFENDYQIPIINSVNGRPDYDYSDILWYRNSSEMELLKQTYQKLSGIQVLFSSYQSFLPDTFNGKYRVIPNPVPQFEDNEIVNHSVSKKKYKIVNIASLAVDCKQQHIAIEAFAAISDKFPNWELHFWGIGNDFDFLNKKIQQLNLHSKVFLNGFTDDPVSRLKESDIFIFPSKYEGFPLALTEAMSIGLPAIGFISCSGVNELIKHNVSGLLAQNQNELEVFLEKLMTDSALRSELGKNAHIEMKKFSPEKILQEWNVFVKSFIP